MLSSIVHNHMIQKVSYPSTKLGTKVKCVEKVLVSRGRAIIDARRRTALHQKTPRLRSKWREPEESLSEPRRLGSFFLSDIETHSPA